MQSQSGCKPCCRGQRRLIVADVAVKSLRFWIVEIYVPTYAAKRRSFFLLLGLFLTGLKQTALVVDWNSIFDSSLDRFGQVFRGSVRCESNLIYQMAEHDLINRLGISPSNIADISAQIGRRR